MIYIGTIDTIHLNQEGLPVCAVIDGADNYYYPCSSLSVTAGFHGVFSSPSLRVGAKVALVANNNPGNAFYIIGGIADARDALAVGVDGIDTAYAAEQVTGSLDVNQTRTLAAQNVDYDDVHLEDYHIENTDNFINIGENGITLSSENRVSVQIPATGLFRVSSAGTANNQVLNATPHLDRLYSYISSLQLKIDALEKAVTAMAPINEMVIVAEIVIQEAAVDSGVLAAIPLLEQAQNRLADLTTATTTISALGPLTPATTIRSASDQDINDNVRIP